MLKFSFGNRIVDTQWLLLRRVVKIADRLFLWRRLNILCAKWLKGLRTIVTYNLPHPSPMFHSMVMIVCSLSVYLSNSLIVDLDRRFGPPQPTNPANGFL